METNKQSTLCWKCAKACGGCSWSNGTFTPVEGWTAEKTRLHVSPKEGKYDRYVDSYIVNECPEFEDDTGRYNKPTRRRYAHAL